MGYILLNLGPILLATLAGLAFAWLWNQLFDRSRPAFPGMAQAVLAAAAQFWLAAILAGALILAPTDAPRLVMALGTPVIIWVGFVLPALLVSLKRRGVATGATLAECGMWLGIMLVQAPVMEAVGVAAAAPV